MRSNPEPQFRSWITEACLALVPTLADPVRQAAGMLKGKKSLTSHYWLNAVRNVVGRRHVANNASAYVLDSFAVLAYFEGEPGMARVRTLLTEATKGALALHLSVINLGEILYIIEREQGLAAAQRALAAH